MKVYKKYNNNQVRNNNNNNNNRVRVPWIYENFT